MALRVGDSVGEAVLDRVGEGDGCCVGGVGETVRVIVRVGEAVGSTLGSARVAEGEGVARVKVRVGAGVDTEGVRVAVGLNCGVLEAVGDRVNGAVQVRVGLALADRVGLALGVGVRVGESRAPVDVALGVAVAVGPKGPGPTRKRICASGPKLPARSRTLTLTRVSPSGKISCRVTCTQNCTCAESVTNAGLPKRSLVHANAGAVATTKLQARSLIASVTERVNGKSGRVTPGTPPSQTVGLPSPNGWLATIHRSGRTVGSRGSLANTV